MKEYIVLDSNSSEGLERLVNQKLEEGWTLVGGVSVCAWFEQWENTRKGNTESDTYSRYAQALIKSR